MQQQLLGVEEAPGSADLLNLGAEQMPLEAPGEADLLGLNSASSSGIDVVFSGAEQGQRQQPPQPRTNAKRLADEAGSPRQLHLK